MRILLAAIIFYASAAVAQPLGWGEQEFKQELETDRPDFTEGTQSVQTGHIQFELGYTYARVDKDTDSNALPELLVRFGIVEELEFRLAWEGYLYEEVGEETEEGTSDMTLGFKHRIYYQDGFVPDFSFLGDISLPVGSLGSDEVEVAGKFLWAYGFEDLSLAGNINFSTPVGEEGRYLEFSTSLALGTSITEDIGLYSEYFAFFPTEDVVETTEQYLNGGITFMLAEDLQLDARAGFGINDAADDFFTGLGLSFRI